MKNYFLLFFFSLGVTAFSKSPAIDSIKVCDKKLLTELNFQTRKIISKKMEQYVLQSINDGSILALDSLTFVSMFLSSNKSFILLSWELATDENSFEYACIVAVRHKKGFSYSVLTDKANEMKNPEFCVSNPTKWYGAHYYQMIENRFNNKVYYTLIGIDWKSLISKRKVIEVITQDSKGDLVFGEPIIQVGRAFQRRYILEYKYDITVNCRYNSKTKMIVFDHLVPPNNSLKNQKQFYVNDFSFDALKFVKGKWMLIEDVDARNEKTEDSQK